MLPEIATDDEDIYLTADPHFYHGNIIKYLHRPFLSLKDQAELAKNGGRWHDGSWKGPREVKYTISNEGVEIMNNSLIDNINKTVPKSGHLIILGDFSPHPKYDHDYPIYQSRCRRLVDRINCQKISMIWGNHDAPHAIDGLFRWSGFKAKIALKKLGAILVLDHYFNAVYDESHRGAYHVYGHTHAEAEEAFDRLMPGRRSMDVGVDNAARLLGEYRPFRLKEVLDLLSQRNGWSFSASVPTNYKGPREHS